MRSRAGHKDPGPRITVVDDDVVEHKNLNRIANTTLTGADSHAIKVQVFERAAAAVRPCTVVKAIPRTLGTLEAIDAIGHVDLLFCCVDTFVPGPVATVAQLLGCPFPILQ